MQEELDTLETQEWIDSVASVIREDGAELPIVKGVDFKVRRGEVVALIGESGSGKTTFLRSLAGLQNLPSAVINFNDEVWQNDQIFVPTHKAFRIRPVFLSGFWAPLILDFSLLKIKKYYKIILYHLLHLTIN